MSTKDHWPSSGDRARLRNAQMRPAQAGSDAPSPEATGRLRVILVNYNTLTDVECCVGSLLEHGIVSAEQITVVDNASPDGSGAEITQRLPDIDAVLLQSNLGYGGAINRGVAVAPPAEFYLVLNPDTHFDANTVAGVFQHFDRDDQLGLLGLNLINHDGTPQYSARRFYSLLTIALRRTPLGRVRLLAPVVNRHLMVDERDEDLFEADWVLGAGFVVRRRAFESVSGMDEKFFLYLEDVDLCARLWLGGWKVCCARDAVLFHKLHRSSARRLLSGAALMHLKSAARFHEKFGIPAFAAPRLATMQRRYRSFRDKVGEDHAR